MTSITPPPVAPPPTAPEDPNRGEAKVVAWPEQIAFDSDGRLISEINCRACGYVLRGTRPEEACPECGERVSESLRGDLLQFANRAWLDAIANGFKWLLASLIVAVSTTMLSSVLTTVVRWNAGAGYVSYARVMPFFNLVTALLTCVAIWKITTRDPRRPELGVTPRIARGAAAAAVAIGVPSAFCGRTAWSFSSGGTGSVVPVFVSGVLEAGGYAVGIIAIAALMFWVARLSRLIPHVGIARHLRVVAWSFLGSGGMVLLSILSIQASWMYAINLRATHATPPSLPAITMPPPDPDAAPVTTLTLPDGTIRTVYQPGAAGNPRPSDLVLVDQMTDGTRRTLSELRHSAGSFGTETIETPAGLKVTTVTHRDVNGNVTSHNTASVTSAVSRTSVADTIIRTFQIISALFTLVLWGLYIWGIVLFVRFYMRLNEVRSLAQPVPSVG